MEFEQPKNELDYTFLPPSVIHDEDAHEVIGTKDLLNLQFNPEKLSDPTYLSFARWIASEVLTSLQFDPWDSDIGVKNVRTVLNLLLRNEASFKSDSQLSRFLRWNRSQDPKGVGILWRDDIEQIAGITNYQILLPLPKPEKNPKAGLRHPYGDWAITYTITAMNAIQSGIPVGFVSGVYDILHGGHIRFLHECARQLYQESMSKGKNGDCLLIVAIDDDSIVKKFKGDQRPLLTFNQRVSAINNLTSVSLTTYHIPIPLAIINPKDARFNDLLMPYLTVQMLEGMDRSRNRGFKDQYKRHYGSNLFHFFSEVDVNKDLKSKWVESVGGNVRTLPQWVNIHSTDLEEHFGLKKKYIDEEQ